MWTKIKKMVNKNDDVGPVERQLRDYERALRKWQEEFYRTVEQDADERGEIVL